jgi:hypothetical protein
MPLDLEVDQALDAAVVQPVKDENGTISPLALSTNAVCIGTTTPQTQLTVAGDVTMERNGSPKLSLHSRGFGTQHYSIRATNDQDSAGGRLFVIRNESDSRDDIALDSAGNVHIVGDVNIERSGSPKLTIRSRGSGTQHFSIRATNNQDPAGGRCFVIRNESGSRDEIILDSRGNVSIAGDIILTGADCAEDFDVEGPGLEAGTVLVIGDKEKLRRCTEAYDKRVAGVISGAGDCKPGIILGTKQSQGKRVPVALTGKVYCKVDARYAPVEVGDLLTTSPSSGHAMKANDPFKSFGAVIGKALRPLTEGKGLIPILIALQ